MKLVKILFLLVLLFALAAAGAAWWAWTSLHRPHGSGEVVVEVAPGTPAVAILSELERRRVIADERLARAYLVYGLGDPALKAGEYRFEGPLSDAQVLDQLIRGSVLLHQVTIVEGLSLEETAQGLADAGFGEREAFLAAMRDPAAIADLDPEAEDLEGYLFPDTYSFRRGAGEAEIVGTMVGNFRTRFEETIRPLLERGPVLPAAVPETDEPDEPDPAPLAVAPDGVAADASDAAEDAAGPRDRMAAGAPAPGSDPPADPSQTFDPGGPAPPPDEPVVSPGAATRRALSIRELVTLASIVEKEAKVDSERPTIAAVYRNRLALGMGLYADPTVIFALKRQGLWDGNLTRANLQTDSPYNTYRFAGLPPGPIASPGLGSLRAAARPEAVDYLYFVSRNDGTHVFAKALAEHNENVRRWQKEYWRERRAEERRALPSEAPGAAPQPR